MDIKKISLTGIFIGSMIFFSGCREIDTAGIHTTGREPVIEPDYSGESPDLGGLSLYKETETHFIDYARNINTYNGNKTTLERNIKKTEKILFCIIFNPVHKR
jgi:hypothetical protein